MIVLLLVVMMLAIPVGMVLYSKGVVLPKPHVPFVHDGEAEAPAFIERDLDKDSPFAHLLPADYEPPPRKWDDPQFYDRGGILWTDAPIPPKLHKCFAWTKMNKGFNPTVSRCACGAMEISPDWRGMWSERNSR